MSQSPPGSPAPETTAETAAASTTETTVAPARPVVLIVEDENLIRFAVLDFLSDRYDVIGAANAAEAQRLLASRQVDVLFTDVRMPGEMDGLDLATWVSKTYPRIVVMITTGHMGNRSVGETSIKPLTVLWKPYQLDEVDQHIATALTRQGWDGGAGRVGGLKTNSEM